MSPCHYLSTEPGASIDVDLPGAERDVLLFDPRTEWTDELALSLLSATGLLDRPFGAVIVRGADETFAKRVAKNNAFQQLSQVIPAGVLVGSTTPTRRNPKLTMASPEGWHPTLAVVRALEVRGILAARGAILEAGDAHFHLNSGVHQSSYLRLGDAMLEVTDLRRLADWLMPLVRDRAALLGDRRSLTPLLQAVQFAVHKRFNWDVDIATIEAFSPSAKPSLDTMKKLAGITRRPLTVLVGVDRDARRSKWLTFHAPRSSSVVTLVDITAAAPASDPFVHFPIPSWPVDRNSERCGESCPEGVAITIDPRTEERTTRQPRGRKTITNAYFTEERREFWKAVSDCGALRIHQDVEYPESESTPSVRHRPIDIDVSRALVYPELWTRCLSALGELDAPDVVLIPQHDATSALVRLAETAWPNALVEGVPAGDLSDEVAAMAHRANRLALLDDAVVTGTTLRRLVERLRVALGESELADKAIAIFAPVICATNREVERQLRSSVTRGARSAERHGESGPRVTFGIRVPLPPDDACPWCLEVEVLTNCIAKLPQHADVIRTRLEAIEQSATDPELLLLPQGSEDDPAERVVEDSVIGPELQVSTVYAAWASAIQDQRYEADPHASVLPHYIDLAHFIDRWRGVGLFAGVLRTVTESEGKYAAQASAVRAAWQGRPREWDRGELVQFAWAALADRVPRELVPLILEALDERSDREPELAFARDLVAARTDLSSLRPTAVAARTRRASHRRDQGAE